MSCSYFNYVRSRSKWHVVEKHHLGSFVFILSMSKHVNYIATVYVDIFGVFVLILFYFEQSVFDCADVRSTATVYTSFDLIRGQQRLMRLPPFDVRNMKEIVILCPWPCLIPRILVSLLLQRQQIHMQSFPSCDVFKHTSIWISFQREYWSYSHTRVKLYLQIKNCPYE